MFELTFVILRRVLIQVTYTLYTLRATSCLCIQIISCALPEVQPRGTLYCLTEQLKTVLLNRAVGDDEVDQVSTWPTLVY